jgi:hypothetical protein
VPLPRLFWLIVVFVFGAIALLIAGYRSFGALGGGHPEEILLIFAEELTGSFATCVLAPGMIALFRRVKMPVSRLARGLAIHLAVLLAYSVAHTSLLELIHRFVFPLVGLPSGSYLPQLREHAAQEFCHDAIAYGLCVVIVTMWNFAGKLRERELKAVQLERALVDAQLLSLRAQLQPHFLFNALNTIASAIYDDPKAAERMIAQLAKLLRATLHKSSDHEVPLRQELETLRNYTALLEARFGQRLQVRMDIQPDAESARVPALVLQPLVENVLRHGVEVSNHPVHVDVRARVRAGELAIDIEDDGPGSNGRKDVLTKGIGLSSSAERLRLLYGEHARLDACDRADGGFRVNLRLPLRSGR